MQRRYTLDTFYKSDAWIAFRQIVIANRLTADGITICEHCGKPIIKAYDLILHHKLPLTEDNVNDVYISLCEDNIQIVHHGCHNKIHDRLGLSKTKQIYLVYGAPLSGKSTWVNDSKGYGDLIVDIDSIWQCVSGCDRYVKPKRLQGIVFGVRDKLLDDIRYRRGNWINAYVIGGYPLISERQRLCRMLGATEIFIDCTIDECMDRLHKASDGRNINDWENYICNWFRDYSPPPV